VNITTIGRGTIGGGLARIWEQAGHKITLLGHSGGDASDADAVLVAVPSGSISDALDGVTGLESKIAIDATNAFTGRNELGRQRVRPGCLYVADDEARDVTQQLIRDAGYEPESIGGLENARALEDFVAGVFMKLAPGFYRFAAPGEL
jgi:8-hydroxy-5-deazaflavin:NADPH oxidoreductase